MNEIIESRKKDLLKGNEVQLAIEGRFTNLRIFKGKKDNIIYFRLDCCRQYSACLSDKTIQYLYKEHKVINKLNELYGFDKATINDIENILELTKEMEKRDCCEW